jgi:hypothetical protein
MARREGVAGADPIPLSDFGGCTRFERMLQTVLDHELR